MKGIQIVEVDSELGAGTRGASLGIEALKIASLNAKSDYFKRFSSIKVANENQRLWNENTTPNAIHIDGVSVMYERICDAISKVMARDDFPVVLAGDHSSAGGTIAGIKKANPDKRLGVIWIDAHGDLHTPYTSPSGNIHGMPLATALAIDNEENKCNEPVEVTRNYWNALKNTGGMSPKIVAEDLVFYGVRDTEQPEVSYMNSTGIKNFTVAECREKGVVEAAKEGLSLLDNCDIIYVSFDVDSMDADLVSHGTGTPVSDGFTPKEAGQLLHCFAASPKLACVEFVEVNPCLDEKQNTMAETAFALLEETTKTIESNLH